jgi:hypothetical protein
MQKNIWLLVGKVTEGNKVKNYIFMNNNGNTQFIQHRSLDKFYRENTILNVQIYKGSVTGKGMSLNNIPRYVNQQGFGLQQVGGMSQQEVIQQCQPLIDEYKQKEQEKSQKKQDNTKNEQKAKQEDYINNKLIILGNIIDIALVMKDITNEMANNGQFTRYLKQIDIDNAEGDSLTNLIQRQGVRGLANGIEDRLDRLNNRVTKYNLDSSFKSKISELKNNCETLKKLHQNTKDIIKDNKEQEEQRQKEEKVSLKKQQAEEIEIVDEVDEDAIAIEDEVETVDEVPEDAVAIEDEIEVVDEIEEDAVAIEEEIDEIDKFEEKVTKKLNQLNLDIKNILDNQKILIIDKIHEYSTGNTFYLKYKTLSYPSIQLSLGRHIDYYKETYKFEIKYTIYENESSKYVNTKEDIEKVINEIKNNSQLKKAYKHQVDEYNEHVNFYIDMYKDDYQYAIDKLDNIYSDFKEAKQIANEWYNIYYNEISDIFPKNIKNRYYFIKNYRNKEEIKKSFNDKVKILSSDENIIEVAKSYIKPYIDNYLTKYSRYIDKVFELENSYNTLRDYQLEAYNSEEITKIRKIFKEKYDKRYSEFPDKIINRIRYIIREYLNSSKFEEILNNFTITNDNEKGKVLDELFEDDWCSNASSYAGHYGDDRNMWSQSYHSGRNKTFAAYATLSDEEFWQRINDIKQGKLKYRDPWDGIDF